MVNSEIRPTEVHSSDRQRSRPMARALAAPVRTLGKVLPRPLTGSPSAAASHPSRDPGSAIVDCGLYIDGVRRPGRMDYVAALEAAKRNDNAFVWLGLHDATSDEFADIAKTFGLHELAVEDTIVAFARPKLERYADVTFVVIKTARYIRNGALTATSEVVETGDVMLFLGERFAITVRHGDACRLRGVRANLEQREDLVRQGPWAVFHAVVDQIVDRYVEVVDAIEDDIDELEASVFDNSNVDIPRIYKLKREVVELKRAVLPLARPLESLVSGAVMSVPQEIRRYIRDVADHHSRVVDQIASFDDLLNSILQASLAQAGIQQNNDMRKISAYAAIGVVPTAVAGIYGMNFEYMPELGWRFGYPMILFIIFVICFGLYRLFKKSEWL
ncbi:magnesium and cobalt transport protein CorA [Cryptosporangium minutisporangium]|uniref:Magnesium/cobalt transporter CorA n=1 Tax=Cryptosporangium minutisporangium TaxID=113569 RepID=A0ABP6T5N6_9ACTN